MSFRLRSSLRFAWRNSLAYLVVLVIAASFAGGLHATEPAADAATSEKQGLELFTQHVRVVLAHNCLSCHGGDATESEFDPGAMAERLEAACRETSETYRWRFEVPCMARFRTERLEQPAASEVAGG